MVFLTITLVCVVGSLLLYTYYMSHNHGMFKKMGIAGPTPWPVFGTMLQSFAHQGGIWGYYREMYQKYKKDKVFGLYRTNQPTLVICDLDMIREMCVKQFPNFINRATFDVDGIIGQSMTQLTGDHWKRVRATVSPCFNTVRLKKMFPHLERNANLLLEHLQAKQETNQPVELKDLFSALTMDTIASTGFGVEVNSLQGETEFTKQGKNLLSNMGKFLFIAFFCKFLTPIIRLLGISMFDKEAEAFFTRFIDQAIEMGKQNNEHNSGRSDFLQLMLEAEKEELNELNDKQTTNSSKKILSYDDIRGQAMVFLLGGYDTTSTAMSFTLFFLAMNPECMKRVQEELDHKLQGKFPDYESAQELAYLEMCIHESIRLMPPGFIIDRNVEEECEIMGVKIPKGISVTFPVIAIHKDPEIWENPDQFDPERFTPENKAFRHPYAYLGFGHGPRNCIGMRLALMEVKVVLAAFLQRYVPVQCEKTVYPPVLMPIEVRAKDGLWVKIETRKL